MVSIQGMMYKRNRAILGRIPYSSILKAKDLSKKSSLPMTTSQSLISNMSPKIIDAKIINGKRKKRVMILGLWEFEL